MALRELDLYQVDAFSERPFAGNPAAVVPLAAWLSDAEMQAIAAENNLAETAFFVREGEGYGLRWFTPAVEVDLCGHATLASAYVISRFLDRGAERIAFATRSGELPVSLAGDLLTMDFPSRPPAEVAPELKRLVEAALGTASEMVLQAPGKGKFLAVLESAAAVLAAKPDLAKVLELPGDGLIVTAEGPDPASGKDCDFVSRYFAPHAGIPEDPVTGSAHCVLTPYWAGRLGRNRLEARQVSVRGGDVLCELAGERVLLSGKAALYSTGKCFLPG